MFQNLGTNKYRFPLILTLEEVFFEMKTIITGFHQDEHEQWVADLSCGHSRHFRHDPPWQQREWVTSPQGRKTYIGFELDCKTCGSPDVK